MPLAKGRVEDSPGPARRRTPLSRVPAGLTAIAGAVVLLVSISSCSSDGRSAGGRTADESQPPGIIGFRWRIVEVRHSAKDVPIPARLNGYIALGPDRHLMADDSVNYHQGQFTLTTSGFRATNVSTTLVGYDGRDPAVVALIAAIDVLTQGEADVTARATGDRLILSAADYLITCAKAGTVGITPTPAPSPTRTAPLPEPLPDRPEPSKSASDRAHRTAASQVRAS